MEIRQLTKNFDGTLIEIKFGVWRCAICGEVYYAFDRPNHCPFCGSASQFLMDPKLVTENRDVIANITQTDTMNLRSSIRMEVVDSRYYTSMSKRKESGTDDLRSMYARLAKIEAEHCKLFCRLLGNIPVPEDMKKMTKISDTWKMNIEESMQREHSANEIYARYASATTNERLRQVWMALSRVELEHYVFERTQLESYDFIARKL